MNKTIRDGPQINTYYTREYFWRTYKKFIDRGYVIEGIYPENTLLEVNFGDYDVEVHWIKKEALEEEKERHKWERYSFNCFNKKNEHNTATEKGETY